MARLRWRKLPGFGNDFRLRAFCDLGTFILRVEPNPHPRGGDHVRLVFFSRRASFHRLSFGGDLMGEYASVREAQDAAGRMVGDWPM